MKPSMIRRQEYAVRREHCVALTRYLLVSLTLISSASLAADCDLRASSAEADYGEIHRVAVFPGRSAQAGALGKRTIVLNAACRQTTTFSFRMEGATTHDGKFKFGNSGHFIATLRDATVDGNSVQLTTNSATYGTTRDMNGRLAPATPVTASAVNGLPVKGKTFSALLEIDTYLGEADTHSRDRMKLEGTGALSMQPN